MYDGPADGWVAVESGQLKVAANDWVLAGVHLTGEQHQTAQHSGENEVRVRGSPCGIMLIGHWRQSGLPLRAAAGPSRLRGDRDRETLVNTRDTVFGTHTVVLCLPEYSSG